MNRPTALERRPATYQDVLDAPPNMVAELIRGALHVQPRPRSPHALAASALGGKIGGPFTWDAGGPGGWWIIFEPELHFKNDVVPIRNRLSHMRLLKKGDRTKVRTWVKRIADVKLRNECPSCPG